MIADDEIEPIVRPVQNRVRTMLAHTALEAMQQLGSIGLIRFLGVAHPIKAGALWTVADQQQGVLHPAHALAILNLRAIWANLLQHALGVGVGAEHGGAAFARDQEPSLIVEAHVDERKRAIVVGKPNRLLDFEALGHSELVIDA